MKFSIILLTTLASQLAFANTVYKYDCISYLVNGSKNSTAKMILNVEQDYASADILNELWDNNFIGGQLNNSYRSKSKNMNLKYGRNLIIEDSLVSGGRQLENGDFGGFAKIEGEVEGGFFQYKFICKMH